MRVLFVGAHFDDDFPISAILRRHRLAGDSVFMVWSTLPLSDKSRNKRFLELRKALSFASIPVKNCTVLSYPDRRSYLFSKELYSDLVEILKHKKPDLVYVPAFEGGNIDHDTTHVLTVKAIAKNHLPAKIKEFSLYNSHGRPHMFPPQDFCTFIPCKDSKIERIELSPEESIYMQKYFKVYSSQYLGIKINMRFFNRRHDHWQYIELRSVPKYRYLHKPTRHLTYERYQDVTFNDFKKCIKFLYKPKARIHAGFEPTIANQDLVKKVFKKRTWHENYAKKVMRSLMHL